MLNFINIQLRHHYLSSRKVCIVSNSALNTCTLFVACLSAVLSLLLLLLLLLSLLALLLLPVVVQLVCSGFKYENIFNNNSMQRIHARLIHFNVLIRNYVASVVNICYCGYFGLSIKYHRDIFIWLASIVCVTLWVCMYM